ncbi:MAG TPA: hypothetical protein VF868_03340 [Bacteroidia bacterium]|jgi:hypothetical protein
MNLKNLIFLLLLIPAFTFSQEGVRNTAKKEITGKIMLVPYEPQMYMGDIGEKIYIESKWNFKQLAEYFRHQLDNQLKLKLQSIESPIVSFYIDSAKTSKDLEYIYKSTTIGFDIVGKPSAPTALNKKEQTIKNGQLVVEASSDKKFTTAKLSNNELLPFLTKKYKSEYFVFVNELDIKTVPDSYDIASDTYQREVTVHYTIVDQFSKLVSAGAASSRFSSKINEPKRIVSITFPPIASLIASKLEAVLKPKKE